MTLVDGALLLALLLKVMLSGDNPSSTILELENVLAAHHGLDLQVFRKSAVELKNRAKRRVLREANEELRGLVSNQSNVKVSPGKHKRYAYTTNAHLCSTYPPILRAVTNAMQPL